MAQYLKPSLMSAPAKNVEGERHTLSSKSMHQGVKNTGKTGLIWKDPILPGAI